MLSRFSRVTVNSMRRAQILTSQLAPNSFHGSRSQSLLNNATTSFSTNQAGAPTGFKALQGQIPRDPVTGLFGFEASGHEDDEVITSSMAHFRSMVLHRPKQLNALNLNMVEYITQRLKVWDANPDVGMSIVRGVGPKAFCAGGDILALYKDKKSKNPQNLAQKFFHEEYRMNYLTSIVKKPYVAWLNGITMGGGVGLSVHSRYRVSTEKTMFAMPETAIGFFPDVGGSHFLPRLDGELGMYLGLTGARLSGSDIFHAGISTHHSYDERFEVVQTLLEDSRCAPADVEAALDAVSEQASRLAPFSLAPHLDTIDFCFGKDSVEEIIKALQQHVDQGKDAVFCKNALKLLADMSPTSLKVTFLQIRKGKFKDLKSCLKMEYRVAMNMMNDLNSDFYTGVHHVLVLKERNAKPKWNPPTLAEVSSEKVEAFFKKVEGMDDLDLSGLEDPNEIVRDSQVPRE